MTTQKDYQRNYEFNNLVKEFSLEDLKIMRLINRESKYVRELTNAYDLNLDPGTLFKRMKKNRVTSRHYLKKFIRDQKFNELYNTYHGRCYNQARSEFKCADPKVYKRQPQNVKDQVRERAKKLANKKANSELKKFNEVAKQVS